MICEIENWRLDWLGDAAITATWCGEDAPQPSPAAIGKAFDRQDYLDILPGFRALTLRMKAFCDVDLVLADFRAALKNAGDMNVKRRRFLVPACFQGEDMSAVSNATGLKATEIVELISTAQFTVGAIGFQPGFPYLLGLPKALHLPRRANPRPRVPAGAFAIAGDMAAIYPQASPGGWHLLGLTRFELFLPTQTPPVFFQTGDELQIVSTALEDLGAPICI